MNQLDLFVNSLPTKSEHSNNSSIKTCTKKQKLPTFYEVLLWSQLHSSLRFIQWLYEYGYASVHRTVFYDNQPWLNHISKPPICTIEILILLVEIQLIYTLCSLHRKHYKFYKLWGLIAQLFDQTISWCRWQLISHSENPQNSWQSQEVLLQLNRSIALYWGLLEILLHGVSHLSVTDYTTPLNFLFSLGIKPTFFLMPMLRKCALGYFPDSLWLLEMAVWRFNWD